MQEQGKIGLIIGNNINRKNTGCVKAKIANDKDIKLLIKYGRKFPLIRETLTLVLAIILFVKDITDFSISLSVLLILPAYSFVTSFKELCRDLKEWFMGIIHYFSFLSSRSCPKEPLDIWRFHQGSSIDLQMFETLKRFNKSSGDALYSGEPYYKPIYIDSIIISWKNGDKLKLREKWRFKKIFERYARRTLVAHADQKYFREGNKHIESSHAVFGILFSSLYFKSEIEALNRKNGRIKIEYKIDKNDTEKYVAAKEWLHYCLTPDIIERNNVDNKDLLTLVIEDIITDNEKITNKNSLRNKISLPVKRYIVIPEGRDCTEETYCPFPAKTMSSTFFSLGGSEQNLALQCIISQYIWQNPKSRRVGFAENAFEEGGRKSFLTGTEGLVYGVTESVIGRILSGKDTCKSEVFIMPFEKWNICLYSIFGYSAPATKMSFTQLLMSISKSQKDFIPAQRLETANLIEYKIKNTDEKGNVVDKIFDTYSMRQWDNLDLMNSPEELRRWLEDTNENFIEVNSSEIAR